MQAPRWFRRLAHWLVGKLAGWVGIMVLGSQHKRLVLPWRARLRVLGGDQPYVRPVFQKAERVRYGWQDLAFEPWPEPDYESLIAPHDSAASSQMLCVLLAHKVESAERSLQIWQDAGFVNPTPFLVFGGTKEDFERVRWDRKVWCDDPRLRSAPAPAAKQSYRSVFRLVAGVLPHEPNVSHILLAEFDLLPLQKDLPTRLLQALDSEAADVLLSYLSRVDQTNAPHYLYHLQDPSFASAWKAFSLRENPESIFNALVVGSVWRKQAWVALSEIELPVEVYLEMEIPTNLHHLGFRIRNFPRVWTQFLRATPWPQDALKTARNEQAPWLHPWKFSIPDKLSLAPQ